MSKDAPSGASRPRPGRPCSMRRSPVMWAALLVSCALALLALRRAGGRFAWATRGPHHHRGAAARGLTAATTGAVYPRVDGGGLDASGAAPDPVGGAAAAGPYSYSPSYSPPPPGVILTTWFRPRWNASSRESCLSDWGGAMTLLLSALPVVFEAEGGAGAGERAGGIRAGMDRIAGVGGFVVGGVAPPPPGPALSRVAVFHDAPPACEKALLEEVLTWPKPGWRGSAGWRAGGPRSGGGGGGDPAAAAPPAPRPWEMIDGWEAPLSSYASRLVLLPRPSPSTYHPFDHRWLLFDDYLRTLPRAERAQYAAILDARDVAVVRNPFALMDRHHKEEGGGSGGGGGGSAGSSAAGRGSSVRGGSGGRRKAGGASAPEEEEEWDGAAVGATGPPSSYDLFATKELNINGENEWMRARFDACGIDPSPYAGEPVLNAGAVGATLRGMGVLASVMAGRIRKLQGTHGQACLSLGVDMAVFNDVLYRGVGLVGGLSVSRGAVPLGPTYRNWFHDVRVLGGCGYEGDGCACAPKGDGEECECVRYAVLHKGRLVCVDDE